MKKLLLIIFLFLFYNVYSQNYMNKDICCTTDTLGTWRVLNLSGQILATGLLKDGVISLTHYPPGLYIVTLQTTDKIIIYRIIKV